MKTPNTILILSAILFFMINCENDNPSVFGGKVKSHTDCKYGKTAFSGDIPDTISCISYEFDAEKQKLRLKHINAGFNCCSDIGCTFSADGDTIIINEIETGDKCHCLCLYDLETEITGVQAKTYFIKMGELYSGGMESLIFAIDLSASDKGEFCVTRKTYPWGMDLMEASEIIGGLIASSDCKELDKFADDPSDMGCIHYSYNETTRELTLQHINAAFNCCPDSIYCLVSELNDTIVVEEFEGMGLCNCMCLYDLDIKIEGVFPKSYYIQVVEPGIFDDEKLNFGVDLSMDPSGDYCVPRNDYPWGI